MNRIFCVTILVFSQCLTLVSAGCSKEGSASSAAPSAESDSIINQQKLDITKEKSLANISYTSIEWTDLLPDDDLQALKNPPEYLANIKDGSEGDQLTSQLKAESSTNTTEDRYQQALTSKISD